MRLRKQLSTSNNNVAACGICKIYLWFIFFQLKNLQTEWQGHGCLIMVDLVVAAVGISHGSYCVG